MVIQNREYPMFLEPENIIPSRWTAEALSDERIHDLVIDLTPSDEVRLGRDMGLHVFEGKDPHSDIGRYIEWKVFDKQFGNDMAEMQSEYGPYDSSSIFLVLVDYKNERPAAVLRLIKSNDETGLKSIKDMTDSDTTRNPWFNPEDTEVKLLHEIGDLSNNHTVDVSTMAVMPEYMSAHSRDAASAVLYSSCVRWSLENGYNYWVTIVDKRILTMMQAWGEPFIEFNNKGFEKYLGSGESRPMHLELLTGLQKVKDFDQGVFDLYTRGTGLDSSYILPEFILPESV